jgi:hypothetical protein
MIRIELIRGSRRAVAAAIGWLDEVMPPGTEMPAATVLGLATQAGISRASLLRAKAACQFIVSEKACGRRWGSWTWKRDNSPS